MLRLLNVPHCFLEQLDQPLVKEGLLLGPLFEDALYVPSHVPEDSQLDEFDDNCPDHEEIPRIHVVLELLPALVRIARGEQEGLEDEHEEGHDELDPEGVEEGKEITHLPLLLIVGRVLQIDYQVYHLHDAESAEDRLDEIENEVDDEMGQ